MWILVHLTHLVLLSAIFSNKIFCLNFWSKIKVFFVRATKAKRILFLNHRNRKVVGGKHNVLVHYVNDSAPDPAGFVFCNLFKWDILLFILIKNHFIPQPQKQKSCRRQTQCSSTLCRCWCTQSIWCCPLQPFQIRYFVFISDQKSCCCFCAFHNSKMNFISQPHGQKSCRRYTQCSYMLFRC